MLVDALASQPLTAGRNYRPDFVDTNIEHRAQAGNAPWKGRHTNVLGDYVVGQKWAERSFTRSNRRISAHAIAVDIQVLSAASLALMGVSTA